MTANERKEIAIADLIELGYSVNDEERERLLNSEIVSLKFNIVNERDSISISDDGFIEPAHPPTPL